MDLHSAQLTRASLTSTLSARHTDRHANRMGSGYGGERQGQEIVDAAIWAGMQSEAPLGPANLAGTRSDSSMQSHRRRVQFKESMEAIRHARVTAVATAH